MKTTELTVRKSVVVDLPPAGAFELFTDGIHGWWPHASHSIHGDDAEAVFESRPGGRVYERTADGREADWARVVAWEPPSRFVLEWTVGRDSPPTEVEVRFAAEGAQTRVDLEHRGWERYGDGADEAFADYDGGWDVVLGRYVHSLGR